MRLPVSRVNSLFANAAMILDGPLNVQVALLTEH